jgi:hypothetical protein
MVYLSQKAVHPSQERGSALWFRSECDKLTANDLLNLTIIRILAVVTILLILIVSYIYLDSKSVPNELVTIIGLIIGGFLTMLNREHKSAAGGVSTENVENVTVSQDPDASGPDAVRIGDPMDPRRN